MIFAFARAPRALSPFPPRRSSDLELAANTTGTEIVEGARLLELFPAIDPAKNVRGLYDPSDMDMDVHALHWGFIRGMRASGGEIVTDAEIQGLTRTADGWTVETRAGTFTVTRRHQCSRRLG